MKTKIAPEKLLRWGLQGALVLVVIAVAYAATLHSKIDDMQAAIDQEKQATASTAAASKKISDELRATKAKVAEVEAKLAEAESMKELLARVQPQVTAALESAAKTGKPEVRAALLAGAGIISQVVAGAKMEAATALLDRALTLDKNNCAAGVAMNMSGTKKVDLAPDCQPAAAPAAAEAKPAAAAPAPAAAAANK